jgi:hypothetical protein
MYELYVDVPEGQIMLSFASQKRKANRMQVYKDTICTGVKLVTVDDDKVAVLFQPVVSYQSRKDNYDQYEGVKQALAKFFKANIVKYDVRKKLWEKLILQYAEKRLRKELMMSERIIRRALTPAPLGDKEKETVKAAVEGCHDGPQYGDSGEIVFGRPKQGDDGKAAQCQCPAPGLRLASNDTLEDTQEQGDQEEE